jgi:hypothetical protein
MFWEQASDISVFLVKLLIRLEVLVIQRLVFFVSFSARWFFISDCGTRTQVP